MIFQQIIPDPYCHPVQLIFCLLQLRLGISVFIITARRQLAEGTENNQIVDNYLFDIISSSDFL